MASKNRRKVDTVEYEKRIRIIQEWIIDDWPYTDVVNQIIAKWGIQERQAKRYIKDARERWVADEKEHIDKLRSMKVMSLKKLKRSLQEKYKGTPLGINAVLNVEKELIKLQGLEPVKKIQLDANVKTDLSKLPITFE